MPHRAYGQPARALCSAGIAIHVRPQFEVGHRDADLTCEPMRPPLAGRAAVVSPIPAGECPNSGFSEEELRAGLYGGPSRARTWDHLIKSQLLYQLS